MAKDFYVPTTKDWALTTGRVVTFHTHTDKRFCLDVMKKSDIAVKVKGARIFARPQFGKTTEFGVKQWIDAIKIVARECPDLDKELEWDTPNGMTILKGSRFIYLDDDNKAIFEDASVEAKIEPKLPKV